MSCPHFAKVAKSKFPNTHDFGYTLMYLGVYLYEKVWLLVFHDY